jgi:hypothetical protein
MVSLILGARYVALSRVTTPASVNSAFSAPLSGAGRIVLTSPLTGGRGIAESPRAMQLISNLQLRVYSAGGLTQAALYRSAGISRIFRAGNVRVTKARRENCNAKLRKPILNVNYLLSGRLTEKCARKPPETSGLCRTLRACNK